VEEDDLRLVGLELASTQDPPAYSFSSMGGWNPGLRASVVRTALFKLAGSGIAAGLMSISPHVGRYTSFSCALCAAVNLVASAFYYQIWLVRLQLYGGEKYDIWTANVGRAQASNQKLVAKQAEHDKHVIYWQEVQTDGMRCVTDPQCTPPHHMYLLHTRAPLPSQVRRLAGTFHAYSRSNPPAFRACL
jgi:hypothetical protein